ncbi:hypothetical protein PINS_up021618 [Pythium insidiosum]|nr:hypothetical protein PINS_up021618 [Pythium insidiosum]
MTAVRPATVSPPPPNVVPAVRRSRLSALTSALVGDRSKRYTVSKFLALHAYTRHRTRCRLLSVLLLFPLPVLSIAVLLAQVPLQDPALGVAQNWGFFVQCTLGVFVVSVGVMKMALTSVDVPDSMISLLEIAVIAALGTLQGNAALFVLASNWCFPVPFSTATVVVPSSLGLAMASVLVLRRRLVGSDPSLRRAIATSGLNRVSAGDADDRVSRALRAVQGRL